MDMKDFGAVNYAKNETPFGYKCHNCQQSGLKLWRQKKHF